MQDIASDHKTIMFTSTSLEELTERVVDDYDTFKYTFRVTFNESSTFKGITDGLLVVREQTGFNKIGFLAEDFWTKGIRDALNQVLPEVYGFDVVYDGASVRATHYFIKKV